MTEILFSFPGIIAILFFVSKRSPFPGKEWFLSPFALLLSSFCIGLASLLRYTLFIKYWCCLEPVVNVLYKCDSFFKAFINSKDIAFLGAGEYSLSIIIAILLGIIANKVIPKDYFQNPEGSDYLDFLQDESVLLELVNNKIYVAKLIQVPLADNGGGLLTFIPLMSGFRTKDDEVHYTNLYLSAEITEAKVEEIEITIQTSSLIGIRKFNADAFGEFLKRGTTKILFDTKPFEDKIPEEQVEDLNKEDLENPDHS